MLPSITNRIQYAYQNIQNQFKVVLCAINDLCSVFYAIYFPNNQIKLINSQRIRPFSYNKVPFLPINFLAKSHCNFLFHQITLQFASQVNNWTIQAHFFTTYSLPDFQFPRSSPLASEFLKCNYNLQKLSMNIKWMTWKTICTPWT